jgi:hypothetical protein
MVCMEINQYAEEMEGKVLLLDNKKFLFCISFIGAYYMAYLGFLAYVILQTAKF